MTNQPELVPHYPVIRLDMETGQHYLTQYLYWESPDFGKRWPAHRLATEYPAIMLPKVEAKNKKDIT